MSLHKIIHIYLYIMICTHSFIMPTEITSLQETQLPETVDINDLVSKLSNFIPLPKKTMATRANPNNAADFFQASKVSEILDNALYKKTHPVQFRNILQEPAFSSSTKSHYHINKQYQHGKWSFNFFFNRDSLKSYTSSEDDNEPAKLSSYIDLSSDTILAAWEKLKNNGIITGIIINFPEFDIPDLFGLFAPMRLQEHRIGVLAHYHTKWNNLFIDVKLPFLWAERNFNFTEEEKEKIYNNKFLSYFGEVDEWAFAQQYLISDQLGIGTLEATISMNLIKAKRSQLNAGITLFIPTEYAFKKGLLGTYRELQTNRPELNFADMLSSAGNTAVEGWRDKVSDYFEAAFTQFTANLLQTPLGFDKHPGLALNLSPIWEINDKWTLKSDYSITLLMAIKQKRLMTDKIHYNREITDLFNAAPDSISKIKIIETAITDRLFPYLSESIVLPGPIFHSTSCLQHTRKNNTYMIGYDSWLQLREQILSHSLDREVQFNIAEAEKPYAMQVKVFGKINKIIQAKKRDWTLSLYADYSLFNEALGRDFLINFEIQGTF